MTGEELGVIKSLCQTLMSIREREKEIKCWDAEAGNEVPRFVWIASLPPRLMATPTPFRA